MAKKTLKYKTTVGAVSTTVSISFDKPKLKQFISHAIAEQLGENLAVHMKGAARASLARPSDVRGYSAPSGGQLVNSIGHRPLTEALRRAGPNDLVRHVEVGAGIATPSRDYYKYVEQGTGERRSGNYGGPERGPDKDGISFHDRGKYIPKFVMARDDKGVYHKIGDVGQVGTGFERLMAPIVRTAGPRYMQENFGSNWTKERRKKIRKHLRKVSRQRAGGNKLSHLAKNRMFAEFAKMLSGGKSINNMSDEELSQLIYQFVAVAKNHGFTPKQAGICESKLTHECDMSQTGAKYAIHHWEGRKYFEDVNKSNTQGNLRMVCGVSHPTENNMSDDRASAAGKGVHFRDYKKWIEEFTRMRYGGALGRTAASNFDKQYAESVNTLFKGVEDPASIQLTSMTIGLGKRRHKKRKTKKGTVVDDLGHWPGTMPRHYAWNTKIALENDPTRFLGGTKLR